MHTRAVLVISSLLLIGSAGRALAQQPSLSPLGLIDWYSTALEGAVGYAGLVDDGGPVPHTLVGGAVRIPLSERVSLGPEIVWMKGEGAHRDLMLTCNVGVDLLAPKPGRRAVPYLLVGAGLFQTRDRFSGETFTSTEGGFTAGGGVRIFLTERLYVAPEFRGGWEPHIRVSVTVGVRPWQSQ